MKKKLILAILTISICFIQSINKVNASEDNFTNKEKQYIEELYGNDYILSAEEKAWIKNMNIDSNGYSIVSNDDFIAPYDMATETEMKSIRISNSNGKVTIVSSWKKEFQVKNYDVIAARFQNASWNENKKYFSIINSSTKYKCTDFKVFENGVGCSFKLPNRVKNMLVTLYFEVSGSGIVYATYQHSKTNRLTLNDSKNYSLSANGYGKVLQFNNKVAPYYDNMRGVEINI